MIHLFTYKTLKQQYGAKTGRFSLIHLFTYKTLKLLGGKYSVINGLIHLFTYKTLKPQIVKMRFSPS